MLLTIIFEAPSREILNHDPVAVCAGGVVNMPVIGARNDIHTGFGHGSNRVIFTPLLVLGPLLEIVGIRRNNRKQDPCLGIFLNQCRIIDDSITVIDTIASINSIPVSTLRQ